MVLYIFYLVFHCSFLLFYYFIPIFGVCSSVAVLNFLFVFLGLTCMCLWFIWALLPEINVVWSDSICFSHTLYFSNLWYRVDINISANKHYQWQTLQVRVVQSNISIYTMSLGFVSDDSAADKWHMLAGATNFLCWTCELVIQNLHDWSVVYVCMCLFILLIGLHQTSESPSVDH